jgi:hypothetical protein
MISKFLEYVFISKAYCVGDPKLFAKLNLCFMLSRKALIHALYMC